MPDYRYSGAYPGGGNVVPTDTPAVIENNSTPTEVLNFDDMSLDDFSKYVMEHSDWAKDNSAMVDFWLNEKSYYKRRNTQIADYMKQLKEAGINPILAYQYASGSSLSGGTDSNLTGQVANENEKQAQDKTFAMNVVGAILRVLTLGLLGWKIDKLPNRR